MITVTNDTIQFFENDPEQEIIIYSAGNVGKWVGYYMNRVGIDFFCYLDRDVKHEGALLNGRPIYRPDRLAEYKDRSIKIIVCPGCYKEICSDLLWLERKYGFHALLFVPQYKDFVHHDERYNINKFLGYFRRRLVRGDVPTIVSSDCTAGFLYEALGMMVATPTINTGFESDDFLKLCFNPRKYLQQSVTDLRWERHFEPNGTAEINVVGDLDDIKIYFGHVDSFDGLSERWDRMKGKINWQRILFIMQDAHYEIPLELVRRFDTLNEKHLFISMRSHYGISSESILYTKKNWLHYRDTVIEENFDLIEWVNR